ncbi:MAG: hypothetical protein SNJ82_06030, partial [Gemmataceae bacterium]
LLFKPADEEFSDEPVEAEIAPEVVSQAELADSDLAESELGPSEVPGEGPQKLSSLPQEAEWPAVGELLAEQPQADQPASQLPERPDAHPLPEPSPESNQP